MSRHSEETIGVRYTGWAALDRDPQEDTVEFTCPHCGHRGAKSARHERALYHFTDGFLQDLQGEMANCRTSRRWYSCTTRTKNGALKPSSPRTSHL
jgi:hypothetical protein